PVERVWQRAVETFQKLPIRPKITLGPDGTPSFEFGPSPHSPDADRAIEALLRVPGEVAHSRKRRVALIFDEFQEIVSIDPQLPALMRSIFQMQGDVPHVFLASRRHLMERVFTDENEPLYRLAKPMPLGPIKAD